jgi:hypothetical protein
LFGLKNIELEAAAVFIGHSGVAFGAKPAAPFVPLWVCFLAVQWLDVVWSILVLLGIEKLRIVPGITEANAYDLYYMPYTTAFPVRSRCHCYSAPLSRFLSRRNAPLPSSSFRWWLSPTGFSTSSSIFPISRFMTTPPKSASAYGGMWP